MTSFELCRTREISRLVLTKVWKNTPQTISAECMLESSPLHVLWHHPTVAAYELFYPPFPRFSTVADKPKPGDENPPYFLTTTYEQEPRASPTSRHKRGFQCPNLNPPSSPSDASVDENMERGLLKQPPPPPPPNNPCFIKPIKQSARYQNKLSVVY